MAVIDQMSRQMGISKKEARDLMKKAKKMNNYQGGGAASAPAATPVSIDVPASGMERRTRNLAMRSPQGSFRGMGMGFADGGQVYTVTYGDELDEVPVEYGRKKLDSDTEQLIKGSEFQVRGRYFNNNKGKGTF